MILRTLLFLVLNFGALAIGGLFTTGGVKSDWYSALNKAPWTPPGWVFGFAWTLIMICFAFYISLLWERTQAKNVLIVLYVVQLVLNIAWNPVFFNYHQVNLALVVISLLAILIGYMFFHYLNDLKAKTLLIAPYLLWLVIATSLNAYISSKN